MPSPFLHLPSAEKSESNSASTSATASTASLDTNAYTPVYLPTLPQDEKAHEHHGGVPLAALASTPAISRASSMCKPELQVAIPKRAPQPRGRTSRLVQFRLWFNTYRKLCTFIAILNAVGLALASTGHFNYAVQHSGAMVLGNLVVSVMVRNEVVLRALYIACNLLFSKWPPVWFRLGVTSVLQHLGGVHSGCAGAGLAWLIWKVVLLVRTTGTAGDLVYAGGIFCCVILLVTFVAAFPIIRNRSHNVFERSHRFFGWIALMLTWIFVLAGTQFDTETDSWAPSAIAVIRAQEFWFVILMTVFIALPWTMTRRVPVEVEIPQSRKVAVLKFRRGMQQGLLGRISRSAALEYHLFGLISEGKHADCHYMICGVQGDFTAALVSEPPTHLWTRELKLPHVSNTSKMYTKGIRICTGTGIGSGLSTCMQSPNWFLIWIGSDFVGTFGSTIMDLVERNVPEERRILWDSKQRGKRPDTVKLIEESYKAWGAEVVFITSNAQGNQEMMEGCKSLGIPCYGTLWDF